MARRAHFQTLERTQSQLRRSRAVVPAMSAAARLDVESVASTLQSAIRRWRGCDQSAIDRRHIMPVDLSARALAPVDGHRQLARFRRRPAELAAATRRSTAAADVDAARRRHARRPECRRNATRPTQDGCQTSISRPGKALGVIDRRLQENPLARLLVGARAPGRGTVGPTATLDQWSPEALGRYIGYVLQDVELFNGTVAVNISRFDDPQIPTPLSRPHRRRASMTHHQPARRLGDRRRRAGQRCPPQAATLARALYRDPFWSYRRTQFHPRRRRRGPDRATPVFARGAITVVVAHRPSAIAGVDLFLSRPRVASSSSGRRRKSRLARLQRAQRKWPIRRRGMRQAIHKMSSAIKPALPRLIGATAGPTQADRCDQDGAAGTFWRAGACT